MMTYLKPESIQLNLCTLWFSLTQHSCKNFQVMHRDGVTKVVVVAPEVPHVPFAHPLDASTIHQLVLAALLCNCPVPARVPASLLHLLRQLPTQMRRQDRDSCSTPVEWAVGGGGSRRSCRDWTVVQREVSKLDGFLRPPNANIKIADTDK